MAVLGDRRCRPRQPSAILIGVLGIVTAFAFAEAAFAEPPPWAQAQRTPAENQIAYRFPPGLKDGRCRPEMFDAQKVGRLIGAARLGLPHPRFRIGDRKTATLNGTAIGALLAAIGSTPTSRGLPRPEEICFNQSFEHVPDRTTVAWSDRTLAAQYSVTATRTRKTNNGYFCRKYTAKATVNGYAADVYGTACRQANGDWVLID